MRFFLLLHVRANCLNNMQIGQKVGFIIKLASGVITVII